MHIKIVIAVVFISFLLGILGRNRKMGFWGYFFGSILLTPLIGLLLVLASDKKTDQFVKTKSESNET